MHYQMTTEQQGEDNAAAELSRQQVIAGKIAQQLERQRGRLVGGGRQRLVLGCGGGLPGRLLARRLGLLQVQGALDRKKVSEERMRGRATLTRTSVTGDGGRQRRRERRGESRKRRRSEKAFQCDEKRAAAWLAARTAQWRNLVERRLAEEAAAEQADGDERGAGGVVRAGEAGAGPEQRPQEGGELGRRRILSAGKNSDC